MLSFISKKRKPGWMAVCFSERSVTLAHVQRHRDSPPELRFLESFAVEKTEAAALQRLRSAHQLNTYACTTLLDKGDYTISTLDTPPVPIEERREALRWQLKGIVNYPVDNACLEVLDIPGAGLPTGRSGSVLVVSAESAAVSKRAAPFVAAKIPLETIDVPEFALRNVAALFEDEGRGLVFLNLSEKGVMLILTLGGELVADRHRDVNTVQLNSNDADVSKNAHELLTLEVQRSLDNFDRQYRHISISKLVMATTTAFPGLAAELAQNISVPLLEMDLSSVMKLPALPEFQDAQYQAKHLLAIGAALRDEVEGV